MKQNQLVWFILIFLVAIFFISCTSSKKENTEKKIISFSVDTLQIPIDTLSAPLLDVFCPYFDDNNNFLYNCTNNTLQIIDLNANKVLKTIKLPFGGADGVSEVLSMAVKKTSEIFLQTKIDIVLINEDGNVMKRWKINRKDENLLQNNTGFPLQILDNQALLMQHFRGEIAKTKTTSFATLLDFNTEERKKLPILFSEELQENYKQFEFFAFAQASLLNNKLYYNFPYSSDIFSYNFISKEKISLSIPSNYGKEKANPYQNGQDFEKYMAESVHYLRPLVDKNNGLIYRAYWGTPKLNDSNLFLEKPFYLSILDTNLHILKEIELLHHNYSPNIYFVGQKGLYACVMHPKSSMKEDFLTLHLYKFRVII